MRRYSSVRSHVLRHLLGQELGLESSPVVRVYAVGFEPTPFRFEGIALPMSLLV